MDAIAIPELGELKSAAGDAKIKTFVAKMLQKIQELGSTRVKIDPVGGQPSSAQVMYYFLNESAENTGPESGAGGMWFTHLHLLRELYWPVLAFLLTNHLTPVYVDVVLAKLILDVRKGQPSKSALLEGQAEINGQSFIFVMTMTAPGFVEMEMDFS